MNLARIKFISLFICALCKVQTVCFEKLAYGFDNGTQLSSALRRIQRFMAQYSLDSDLVARFVFALLPHDPPFSLAMDRTNWKFGETNINALVLAVIYQGVAFPILFQLMPKRGNSHTRERIQIMNRFIRLFGKEAIAYLLADREFVGDHWINYLNFNSIDYHIRIRDNFWVKNPRLYKDRWQIETAFRALKSSGFNIEDTHLTDLDRIEKMFSLVIIAFTWSYLVGVYLNEFIKPIRLLNNGRRAKSLFKYGLEHIAMVLLNAGFQSDINIFKFLSCTYENYNNKRIHASIAYTSPNDFRQLWEMNLVDKKVNEKQRKIKFKLKIPYHQIKQLTGNIEPEGSSLLDFKHLNEAYKSTEKEMDGAETSHNLRYKKSPSVVPCLAKIKTNNYICNQ